MTFGYNQVPWTPFSDSINLLEQLMELKKTHLHTILLILL